MIARYHKFLCMFVLISLGQGSHAQAAERWIFEGLITEADPVLAPDLQSGWVLSGSFLLNALELQPQFTSEDRHSGRMTGGVTETEITVDLYRQVLFEAVQQPGLAGFDFQDNTIEADGRDLFGWFFPIVGDVADTGWRSSWLQIWLMDPEGDMISHIPVKVSPYGIDWKSGWFRLTFVDDAGNSVHADGRIEVFCPESGIDDQDGSPWYAIAADLSQQLVQRDQTIRLLEAELSDVKERMEGLRRMVDLLVDERASLQEDNALLQEKAAAADPEMLEKLTELTAEKSLLESQISELSGENEALRTELLRSQQDKQDSLDRMHQLEQQLLSLEKATEASVEPQASSDREAPPAMPAQPSPATDEQPRKPVQQAVLETSAESDEAAGARKQQVPAIPSDPGPESQMEADDSSNGASVRRDLQTRRRGPRKFR